MINVDLRTVEYPFLKIPSETAINSNDLKKAEKKGLGVVHRRRVVLIYPFMSYKSLAYLSFQVVTHSSFHFEKPRVSLIEETN